MTVTYHPGVRRDVREALAYYEEESERLADDFWECLTASIATACAHPERQHFAASGLRRFNLDRFPYHFLYRVESTGIRILVVRHNRRHPAFGSGRK